MHTFYKIIALFVVVVLAFCSEFGNCVETSLKSPLNANSVNFLTQIEFDLYRQSLDYIEDVECLRHLNATLWGIVAGKPWAVKMYDASVKSTFGIESGFLHDFGHFDECLQPLTKKLIDKEENLPVQPKYCLADVTLYEEYGQIANAATRRKVKQAVAQWGVCIPATCATTDVERFLEHWWQGPLQTVQIRQDLCQVNLNESSQITRGMFIYAVIILFFLALALFSTIYHLSLIYAARQEKDLAKPVVQDETLRIALLSFSVIENTQKIFQAGKDQMGLNSINGIKALAMLFILAGHALLFLYAGPAYNVDFMNDRIKMPAFAFVTNSLLFVDIFLLVGGFLFCRLLLIELERRRGRMNVIVLYVARFVRLTPAYLAVIGFYMTWFPRIGNGPLWSQRIEREQARCLDSWWFNIFYINNYFNTDKLCMFQSWYLAVDSQLFFISPIAIFLLYHSRKRGIHLLSLVVVISTLVPFVVSYMSKLDPTLLIYADEVTDLASNDYYTGYYIKTHMRASAYFIGLFTGFLVHVMQEKSIKLPKKLVCCFWTISCLMGFASMHFICRFYASSFTNLESSIYACFHKFGWNLSVAWLVLAVTTNHACWLQKVFSCRLFAPISRLTYCAYLSNGIVELYHSSSVRHSYYRGYVELHNEVWGHILNTFMVAFILCLLFESPIHALERIMLKRFGVKQRSSSSNATEDTNSQSQSVKDEQKV